MLKKILSTIFTKGLVALINLAILLISSKQLGVAVRGEVSILILNIAIIQAINEIYTGYALVHFIPKFSLKKVYQNGFLFSVFCIVLSYFIQLQFSSNIKEQLIHVTILSFVIILHSFHCVIILAKEKIKFYNFLNFYQPIILLLVLLICVFVFNNKTYSSYLYGLYISFLSSLVISSVVFFSILKSNSYNKTVFNGVSIIKNGFYNQLANLSHILSNRFNFYLLATNAMIGVYSTSTTLIESTLIISSSASTIILSQIANQKNENNARVVFLLSKICFLLSTLLIIILLIIPPAFFTFLLGKDYNETKEIMLALSPGILFISFSTIINHYFSGLGKQRLNAFANFSGLLTTILTSYYLIDTYKVLGACYATCLSYFVASIILVFMFMKENKLPFFSLFKIKNDLFLLKSIK